jgi:hypothetical protein
VAPACLHPQTCTQQAACAPQSHHK